MFRRNRRVVIVPIPIVSTRLIATPAIVFPRPFTYRLDAVEVLVMMTGICVGGICGGSSTAITVRMPGHRECHDDLSGLDVAVPPRRALKLHNGYRLAARSMSGGSWK